MRTHRCRNRIGREDVDECFRPCFPAFARWGRSVGSLGPGLTSESADAARAVLRDDLSAGSQVFVAPTGGAGLIRLAWEEAGVHGSGGQRVRAIPSTTEKRWH